MQMSINNHTSLQNITNTQPRRVVIIQRRLTHYRVPFFELLRDELASKKIELELCVGQATLKEQTKNDEGTIVWAKPIKTLYFFNDQLCLQYFSRHLSNASLVIITQENKLLSNLFLLFTLPLRSFKLAFWGHGANLQSTRPNGLKEKFKKWTTKKVHWWFAYTTLSANLIKNDGYNPDQITVLNNSINTTHLKRLAKAVSASEIQNLRDSLGLNTDKVGVFIGSFYADKRLDFLFSAAELIHNQISDFRLLLIGDGTDRDKVLAFCDTHPWARYVGVKKDQEKAQHLALAQLMLNPGLVGLNILDSFSCGIPLITTDCGLHSPEVSYLQNNINGVMTDDDISIYSQKVIELLQNPDQIDTLRMGCHNSAEEYTLENMVKNFAEGIVKCLSHSKS